MDVLMMWDTGVVMPRDCAQLIIGHSRDVPTTRSALLLLKYVAITPTLLSKDCVHLVSFISILANIVTN